MNDKKDFDITEFDAISSTIVDTIDTVLDYTGFEKEAIDKKIETILGVSLIKRKRENGEILLDSENDNPFKSRDWTDEELQRWSNLPELVRMDERKDEKEVR